jgi:hypothetical protein
MDSNETAANDPDAEFRAWYAAAYAHPTLMNYRNPVMEAHALAAWRAAREPAVRVLTGNCDAPGVRG